MPIEPQISVVVPVMNEQDNVGPLVEAVRDVLKSSRWELILVDDGSTDQTRERIRDEISEDARVRLVALARNYGQSTAMQAGLDHGLGEVLVTMDGDLQNDPRDIPTLVKKIDEGYDLVVGYREKRQDKLLTRKVPSWIANRIIAAVTQVPIRDNGCSLKAYKRELIDRIRLYSDMHRFIPAMAAGMAGARIAQVPVRHHARKHGTSKYGLSRILKVLGDLLTIMMIRSFRSRPLVLFGQGAVAASVVGIATLVSAGVAIRYFTPTKASALVLPGVSLSWFALAAFLLMLGLVAEVAVTGYHHEATPELPLIHERHQ